MKTFRIFVSSPGDVMIERRRVERIVSRLNGEFAGTARLETIRWETESYQAFSTFQTQIPPATECDLVVGILKWRLGTPLPPDFGQTLPDGSRYPSGTAYELLTAIARRQGGAPLPDIYIFRFNASAPSVTIDDPQRARTERDWTTLKVFIAQWFENEDQGIKGALNGYGSEDDFEQKLEQLLRKWLADQVGGGRSIRWPVAVKGSPFRGLAAFAAKHASVFFGRSHDIARAVDAWSDAGARGTPFLLLVGASGTGKSSLARAGLLPRLTTPGVIAEVDVWRIAVMRPSDSPDGPFAALAAALMAGASDLPADEEGRGAALPEIAQGDSHTPAELEPVLRRADAAATRPIVNALARIAAQEAERERHGREVRCSLVLLIDQLEELFAGAITDSDRDRFIDLLAALAATGRIWIVATLRADFYPTMLDQPALKALKTAGASYDLSAPGPVERAEIVRGPAEAAGLIYEFDRARGESLDARLLREADRPDMLPLLQLALSRLFERHTTIDGKIVLPFKVYDDLGGLKGIVDEVGEVALKDLGEAERSRLPRLLRQLAVPAHDADGTSKAALTIRAVPLAEAAIDAPSRKLIDALTAARLLTTDGSDAQDADVQLRLTHQRVLDDWSRARTIVSESADFYRIRKDVEDAWRKWRDGRARNELLLARGLPLAEAQSLKTNYRSEISDELAAFIDASARREQIRQRRGYALAMVFGLVAVAAVVAGLIARHQQGIARQQSLTAIDNETRALSALSRQATAENRPDIGVRLALAAWPAERDNQRPRLEATLRSASTAMAARGAFAIRLHHDGPARGALLTRDESRIVSWSDDGILHQWNAKTGQPIEPSVSLGEPVFEAVLLRDENRMLTRSNSGLRLWDLATGRQIGKNIGQAGTIAGARLSGDERRIIVWSNDHAVRTWDLAAGQPVAAGPKGNYFDVTDARFVMGDRRVLSFSGSELALWDASNGQPVVPAMKHGTTIGGAVVTKDGRRAVSWDDRLLHVWDLSTGRESVPPMRHDGPVKGMLLSGDERRLVSWSGDNTIRIWNPANGERVGPAMKQDSISDARLSNDGQYLLAASDDGTLQLWSMATQQAVHPPMKSGTRPSAAFTDQGTRILSWSDDGTIRQWDVATGRQIGQTLRHDGRVSGALVAAQSGRILSWSGDGTVVYWDSPPGRQTGPTMQHGAAIWGATFSKDERQILAWAGDGSLRRWDTRTGQQIGPTMQHGDAVRGAQFNSDERWIVSWANDKTMARWDARTGQRLGPWMQDDDIIQGLLLTADEKRFITWSGKAIRIWEVASGRLIGPPLMHDQQVGGVQLSADGRRLLSWTSDILQGLTSPVFGLRPFGTIRVWDIATGRQIGATMRHDHSVVGARFVGGRFGMDERQILSWSQDNTLQLWDAASGQKIGQPMQHRMMVSGARFSPDGQRILSWSADGTVRLWDPATQQQVGPSMQHPDAVWGAIFINGGRRILSWTSYLGRLITSGRRIGTLQIWDAATGQKVGPEMRQEGSIYGAVQTRDEQRMISWSDDNTVRVWDLATGQQLGAAIPGKGAVLTQDERGVLSWSEDGTLRLSAIDWPQGNLLTIACTLLPNADLTEATSRYGIRVNDRICDPATPMATPDWQTMERVSAE